MKKIGFIVLTFLMVACSSPSVDVVEESELIYDFIVYNYNGEVVDSFKAQEFQEWDNGSIFIKQDGTKVFYSLPLKAEYK